jgi:predicted nucleic acid-binding protein
MRVFLDTNVLLDVLLNRPGLVVESEGVILRCEKAGDPMFIAWHGLATTYYLLRRGRTEAEAMQEVDKLLAWARVADAGDAHARKARGFGFPDFEDALQAASAAACLADCIVTRNVADFTKSQVVVLTPAEFLAKFPDS